MTTINPQLPKVLYLPDTMANWPWTRVINPHYEEIMAASNAWLESFKAFTPQSQIAFNKCDFGRLASLAWPYASREHLRTGCDLMNLFFLIDEYTDVESVEVVRGMVDVVDDALKNPHKPRPEGEIVLGEIARQFWELAVKTATPTSQKHMIRSFTDYLESVVQQANDRNENIIRSIDAYLENRRQNIGIRPSYVPLELGLDLPDHVFYHPVIEELSYYMADLIILDNDIVSYNKEQATGDDRHNILTVVMNQYHTNFEGAIEWVVNYHAEVEAKFLDALKRVPSWGPPMDKQVQQYINGIGNWARGHDCWNFESGRFFGSRGLEIQKTREFPLLPRSTSARDDASLRRENVVVPLIDSLLEKVY